MGLADFLATAGQGKTLGHVAEAFGGQTTQQKAVDDFINNQLPALADQIHKAGTKEDVAKAGQSMITSGLKAGINPQGLDKLMEMTIQPALRNMQAGELEKLGAEYRGQPAQPAESRPPGTEGPLTPSGNFIDPKAATPEKPLDLNFMMKFGQATNANPAQFNTMLETPATIAGKEASNRKTLGEINKEQQAQRQREGLSNEPMGPGLPSLRDIGTLAPGGLSQTLPVRTNPLDEKRGQVMDAQIANLTHLANRPYPEPGGAGGHGSGEYQDYIKLLPPGQTPSMEGFQAYLEQRRGAGKTNETETSLGWESPLHREEDIQTVAQKAHAQGKTTPEGIKAVAASRGLEIEGNPEITMEGKGVFSSGIPTLSGEFTIKKKPRVTTKGKSGQGGYSRGPSGSAPVPPGSAAGGAGGGGGKSLDADTAQQILKEAGGDKAKARALAKQRGYQF